MHELTYEQVQTVTRALVIAEEHAKRNAAAYRNPDARWASAVQRQAAMELAGIYQEEAEEYQALRALLEAPNG